MAKILYVEDHPAQRDILAQMLELGGFEVETAADGKEGVEKALSWLPDVILMDLRMPRMDGFEAIELIRKNEATANTPIIAISAWASGKHRKRAMEVGATEHFTKPVDLNRLMNTVKSYVQDD